MRLAIDVMGGDHTPDDAILARMSLPTLHAVHTQSETE